MKYCLIQRRGKSMTSVVRILVAVLPQENQAPAMGPPHLEHRGHRSSDQITIGTIDRTRSRRVHHQALRIKTIVIEIGEKHEKIRSATAAPAAAAMANLRPHPREMNTTPPLVVLGVANINTIHLGPRTHPHEMTTTTTQTVVLGAASANTTHGPRRRRPLKGLGPLVRMPRITGATVAMATNTTQTTVLGAVSANTTHRPHPRRLHVRKPQITGTTVAVLVGSKSLGPARMDDPAFDACSKADTAISILIRTPRAAIIAATVQEAAADTRRVRPMLILTTVRRHTEKEKSLG